MAAEKKNQARGLVAGLVALSGVELGPVLQVKCSGCKKTREIKPGEIGPLDFPMCDECYMPMLPVKIEGG